MDDPAQSFPDRPPDHVAGAAGVGGQDLGGPAAAHGDDGGGVQHPGTAGQRGVDRGGVGDVALHDLRGTDPVRLVYEETGLDLADFACEGRVMT